VEVLELIKKRCAIRKYEKKQVSKKFWIKFIEAGRWASSIHGFQPWKFLIIRDRSLIEKISKILINKSKKISIGARVLLSSSAETVKEGRVLIAIFNTEEFTKLTERFRKSYKKITKIVEISVISAAIQNMILVAESLGIGSCWLDTPLFCEKEINKLLGVKNEKFSSYFNFGGYPAEKGKRSKRKPISETVEYLLSVV